MIESSHEHYRNQVTLLSDDSWLIPLIQEIGGNCEWWIPNRPWKRMGGKFMPSHKTYASLVFTTQDEPQELCLIEVSQDPPHESIRKISCQLVDHVGWMRLTRFPEDPSLPLLANVLNEGTRRTVVQYLPHHRCTIRFKQTERGEAGFAKIFDSTIGERIHDDGVALWKVYLQGDLGFTIPPPWRWDAHTRTTWQGAVKGYPVATSQLVDLNGAHLAYQMGYAIATLHQSRVNPRIRFHHNVVRQQAIRHGSTIIEIEPHLRSTVESLLRALDQAHAEFTHTHVVPLHTDLHPEQWLEHEAGLGLVDFDRLALGDPEYDVASFLTELEFKDKDRGRYVPAMEAFRNGYESLALPLNELRLQTYQSHRWLTKALRALGKIHTDGVLRAKYCLEQAQHCLIEKASPC